MLDSLPSDGALVTSLRAAFAVDRAVRLAVLFGSAARSATRPDSDVDVAILAAPEGISDSAERALLRELAAVARADVDLIQIERASTLLRWQIARDGIVLFERSPGEFSRFRARAASEYIEFAPALAYHGEVFRRRLMEAGSER